MILQTKFFIRDTLSANLTLKQTTVTQLKDIIAS